MDKRTIKCNQRYVDRTIHRSKQTYMIHDNVHSSEHYELLNNVDTSYS